MLGLQEPGEVSLPLLKKIFQIGRGRGTGSPRASRLIDRTDRPVPPQGARSDLGNNPLLGLLQGLAGAAMLGLAVGVAAGRHCSRPEWP